MSMPKTTMDKNNRAESRKYQIRPTWNIFGMEAITKPFSVKGAPDEEFGLRVFPSNT